jgi:predicted acyltransferase
MTHHAPRLESLDVFRGLSVAAMILVSTPGTWAAVYTPLDHAAWNGWTVTDLVFPFLLFAMGAAVPIALERRRGAQQPLFGHVVKRALVLLVLGLALNAMEAHAPLRLSTFRIPGVLQRIAAVYVIAVVVAGSLSLSGQIALTVAALVGYWLVMTALPVPGVGAGVMTPSGNLASFIDRAVFGGHMLTADFDPEGLLSTVPAAATAMLGVFSTVWLRRSASSGRVVWLWAAGTFAMLLGLAWGRVFPINKNLWTSSFALFSGGIAAQARAVFCWLVDMLQQRWIAKGLAPFGRNALAAYFLSVGLDSVLSRLTAGTTSAKALLYRIGFASWLRPCCGAEAASLAYAVTYVVLWAVVLAEMYRRRIFIGI